MTEVVKLQEIAAEWRRARRIYAVFVALDQYFKLGIGPCRELDCPIDRADTEVLDRVHAWIQAVDDRFDASQLRQLYQGHPLASEENLRALLRFYIEKEKHSDSDHAKTDFLLVHYFSFCAPVALQEGNPTLEDFAGVVEPVLGECSTEAPSWLEPLQLLTEKLADCENLHDLVEFEIIERGRKLKREAGEKYFAMSALLCFAHYNFHARRTFFRLLHSDLIAIRGALIQLERRGVQTVDCLAAGLGDREPLENLNRIAREWKRVFDGDYSRGYSFLSIAGLRLALAAALEKPSIKTPTPADVIVSAPEVLVPEPVKAPENVAVEEKEQAVELESMIQLISAELTRSKSDLQKRNLPVARVSITGLDLVLASWEVAAYLNPDGTTSRALQRAIAARAAIEMNLHSDADSTKALDAAIAIAQVEGAQLQELVAQARERKDIDSAVNLAASGKRLMTVLDQAQRGRSIGAAAGVQR